MVVCLVQLVSFIQPNKPDKPNKQDRLADFFSILLETQETGVYNATDGEAFVSLVKCRSSGGLAQLGEHYVRNVGVGGSTPLPSTKILHN
jgi:hypothetical protein